jgi:hypothetical protein
LFVVSRQRWLPVRWAAEGFAFCQLPRYVTAEQRDQVGEQRVEFASAMSGCHGWRTAGWVGRRRVWCPVDVGEQQVQR